MEMEGDIGKSHIKIGTARIEMAGDFSDHTYICKILKNGDEDQCIMKVTLKGIAYVRCSFILIEKTCYFRMEFY